MFCCFMLVCSILVPKSRVLGLACKFQTSQRTLHKQFLVANLSIGNILNFGQQFQILLPGMVWGTILQRILLIPHLPCLDVIQILDDMLVLLSGHMPPMLQSMLIGMMTAKTYLQTKFTIKKDNRAT